MDKKEMIMKLQEDSAFLSELEGANSVDDILEQFSKHGVDITIDDIDDVRLEIGKADELSESDLENVAGGIAPVFGVIIIVAGIAFTIRTGQGIYDGYKKKQKRCGR